MKFKTKYNVGDIVQFYDFSSKQIEIGSIGGIYIQFSWETLEQIKYSISPIKINKTYIYDSKEVLETNIKKIINKKEFEKEYAKLCAKEVMK